MLNICWYKTKWSPTNHKLVTINTTMKQGKLNHPVYSSSNQKDCFILCLILDPMSDDFHQKQPTWRLFYFIIAKCTKLLWQKRNLDILKVKRKGGEENFQLFVWFHFWVFLCVVVHVPSPPPPPLGIVSSLQQITVF